MPRAARVDVKDHYYHVLNRASARLVIFDTQEQYSLFEAVLVEARNKYNVDIIAYCCMPNHFHLVLQPRENGELSKFMYWFTMTLTQRWHAVEGTTGSGHIFQGRYKAFIIQEDSHLLSVLRYVERNPLRAKLVQRLTDWKYSSFYRRAFGSDKQKSILSDPPVELPNDYTTFVTEPLTAAEIESIRSAINRGTPYGSLLWREKMVDRFNLQGTVRGRGRPKKGS